MFFTGQYNKPFLCVLRFVSIFHSRRPPWNFPWIPASSGSGARQSYRVRAGRDGGERPVGYDLRQLLQHQRRPRRLQTAGLRRRSRHVSEQSGRRKWAAVAVLGELPGNGDGRLAVQDESLQQLLQSLHVTHVRRRRPVHRQRYVSVYYTVSNSF